MTAHDPDPCGTARADVETYLLGGDVTDAELERALAHALDCAGCRGHRPIAALLGAAPRSEPAAVDR